MAIDPEQLILYASQLAEALGDMNNAVSISTQGARPNPILATLVRPVLGPALVMLERAGKDIAGIGDAALQSSLAAISAAMPD